MEKNRLAETPLGFFSIDRRHWTRIPMLAVRRMLVQMINLSLDHLCLMRDNLGDLPSLRFLSKCIVHTWELSMLDCIFYLSSWLCFTLWLALMFSLCISRSKRIIKSRYVLSAGNYSRMMKRITETWEERDSNLRREHRDRLLRYIDSRSSSISYDLAELRLINCWLYITSCPDFDISYLILRYISNLHLKRDKRNFFRMLFVFK